MFLLWQLILPSSNVKLLHANYELTVIFYMEIIVSGIVIHSIVKVILLVEL